MTLFDLLFCKREKKEQDLIIQALHDLLRSNRELLDQLKHISGQLDVANKLLYKIWEARR